MDRNTELLESFKVDPLKEVWDAITRIRDDQAKMRGELDGLLERESTEQSTLDALNALASRVTDLEAFRTTTEVALEGLDERITDLEAAPPDHTHIYAHITDTHNNTAHNPDHSIVGHGHAYTEITGTHDSSDHDSSVATASQITTIDSTIATMKGIYNSHTHQEQDSVFFTGDPTNVDHTHEYLGTTLDTSEPDNSM